MPQIKAAIKAMYEYVKPSFDRLASSIKENILPMIQSFWNLVQAAMPTIRVLFEVAMLAVGTALKIAMDVIAVFIKVVKGIYGLIEPPVRLIINIFGKVAEAIETALGWLTRWNRTEAKDKKIKVTTTRVENTQMRSSHGNNAQGTDYWRGGLTWVGEEGPELINAPRGSQIFSNPKSMAMASSGGASSGVTFGYGAFAGANIMDDYGVDRLMDRVMDRLALKGVR